MQIQAGTWEAESPNGDGAVLSGPAIDSQHERSRSGELAQTTRKVVDENSNDSLFTSIYQDYRRYRAAGAKRALPIIILTQGFWASTIFRTSHWALMHCRLPGLRTVVKALCVLGQKFIEIIAGICIPATCNIGPGLYIGHFGGIFVDSDSRIGANCNLAQGVTIGKGGRGELHGTPVVGDRVHVGANAVILGQITIGNDAVIGPNAVVMNPVPPGGVAMGNPARIVGMTGSFDFVHYDDMENDPPRKMAFENLRSAAAAGEHLDADTKKR